MSLLGVDRELNYGRHLISRFLKRAMPFASVLDIGAGHGTDLRTAATENRQAKLFAVEAYRPYVDELRSAGVVVFPLNVEKDSLPFKSAEVDVVIANQVLEHTKEIFWVLHEISRILKLGGKLIVGVPNLASLHNRFLLLFGHQPTVINTTSAHVRGFTRHDMQRFLQLCFPDGYRLRDYGGSNFYPFPPLIAKPLARIFPAFAWGMFFLLEKQRPYSGGFLEVPAREKFETNFYLGEEIFDSARC